MDKFYLKFKPKYGTMLSYKFHQKLDEIYSSLYVESSYSDDIQSWMILTLQIWIIYH